MSESPSSLLEVINGIHCPLFLIDEHGRVEPTNESAKSLGEIPRDVLLSFQEHAEILITSKLDVSGIIPVIRIGDRYFQGRLRRINSEEEKMSILLEEVSRDHLVESQVVQPKTGVVRVDAEHRITWCNESFARQVGVPAVELVGTSFESLTTPESFRRILGQQDLRAQGLPSSYIIDIICPDGERKVFEVFGSPAQDVQLEEILFGTSVSDPTYGLFLDVTERERAKRREIEKAKLLDAMVKTTGDIIFVLDPECRIVDYHAGREEDLMVPPEQFLGKVMWDILPPEYAELNRRAIADLLETRQEAVVEYSFDAGEGGVSFFEARHLLSTFCDEHPDEDPFAGCSSTIEDVSRHMHTRILIVIRNITEKKKMERKMEEMRIHDPLTGVFNSHYYEQQKIVLETDPRSLAVVIVDIDHLEKINEVRGKEIGDEFLRVAANILREMLPEHAVIAKIGGAFRILIPEITKQNLKAHLHEIHERLHGFNENESQFPDDLSLTIRFSIRSEESQKSVEDVEDEAIQNLGRVKLLHDKAVKALTIACQVKDSPTENHIHRVGYFMELFARALEISENDIPFYKLFGVLHDIGKINVPIVIIQKPGALSPAERKEMAKHTVDGEAICMNVKGLEPIAKWVRHHHEAWDGTGYPDKRSDHDIPPPSRMLAIVDAFDAMLSDERSYSKAKAILEAVDELLDCRGQQFDPDLTIRFIEIILSELRRFLSPELLRVETRKDPEGALLDVFLNEQEKAGKGPGDFSSDLESLIAEIDIILNWSDARYKEGYRRKKYFEPEITPEEKKTWHENQRKNRLSVVHAYALLSPEDKEKSPEEIRSAIMVLVESGENPDIQGEIESVVLSLGK